MKEATAMQPVTESTGLNIVPVGEFFDRAREILEAISQRAFELFDSNGRVLGRDLQDWFRAEAELLHPVHVRVAESDTSLTLEAEVPGFAARELEISLEPRRLAIRGKRETKEQLKDEKTIYAERCADQILRIVDLSADVDASKATATLRNGILELTMPKAAPAKIVRVEPKVA